MSRLPGDDALFKLWRVLAARFLERLTAFAPIFLIWFGLAVTGLL